MKTCPFLFPLVAAFGLIAPTFAADPQGPVRDSEQPGRPERQERGGRPEGPDRREAPGADELQRRRQELGRRPDEQPDRGNGREAAEMRDQPARVNRAPMGNGHPPGGGREPRAEGGPAPEQRHEHLREAMEHLRAAGLPDLAERVGREGKLRIAGPDGRQRPEGQPREQDQRLEGMQRQLRELHGAVDDLRRQVEGLSREGDRKGPRVPGPDGRK